jgi:hypothetical protein
MRLPSSWLYRSVVTMFFWSRIPLTTRAGHRMRFSFDPSSGIAQTKVFAFETPGESTGSPAGKSFRFQAYHRPAMGVGHFNKHLADIGREQGARPPESICRRRCELW